MTDRAAFLAAIVANPDDDYPRLVYADWLDGQNGLDSCTRCRRGFIPGPSCDPETPQKCEYCGGTGSVTNGTHEQAEFIRLQCAIARCSRCDGDGQAHGSDRPFEWSGPGTYPGPCPECDPLRRREREIRDTMIDTSTPTQRRRTKADWLWASQVLGRFVAVTPHQFRRGFISEVTMPWGGDGGWQAHAQAILKAIPIRRVDRGPKECDAPGCRAIREGRVLAFAPCQVCRGTGRLPDWRGDGLVRLTTAPPPRSVRGWTQHFRAGVAGPPYHWESPDYPGVIFGDPGHQPLSGNFNLSQDQAFRRLIEGLGIPQDVFRGENTQS